MIVLFSVSASGGKNPFSPRWFASMALKKAVLLKLGRLFLLRWRFSCCWFFFLLRGIEIADLSAQAGTAAANAFDRGNNDVLLLLIAMDIAVIIAAVSGELQQQFAFIGDCGVAVLDAEKGAGVEIFDRRQHQLPLADYLFRHCCCGCGGSFAFICRWLLRCVISSYPLLGLWLRRGAVHRLCWCLRLHLGLRVCI